MKTKSRIRFTRLVILFFCITWSLFLPLSAKADAIAIITISKIEPSDAGSS